MTWIETWLGDILSWDFAFFSGLAILFVVWVTAWIVALVYVIVIGIKKGLRWIIQQSADNR